MAFLYVNGSFPSHVIDHRDTDGTNNRWDNLRPATNSQNGAMTVRSGLRDIDTIRNFVASQSFATLIDMPFAIILLVALYFLHPVYLLIVLVGGAMLIGLAVINNRLTARITGESIGQSMRAHNFAEDGLRNADVLEGMGMSSTFVDRWRKQWIAALRTSSRASDRDARLSATSRSIPASAACRPKRLTRPATAIGAWSLRLALSHSTLTAWNLSARGARRVG